MNLDEKLRNPELFLQYYHLARIKIECLILKINFNFEIKFSYSQPKSDLRGPYADGSARPSASGGVEFGIFKKGKYHLCNTNAFTLFPTNLDICLVL